MAARVYMIGLKPEEDTWVRLLVSLLRNPDPVVAELARQSLLYLVQTAERKADAEAAAQS